MQPAKTEKTEKREDILKCGTPADALSKRKTLFGTAYKHFGNKNFRKLPKRATSEKNESGLFPFTSPD